MRVRVCEDLDECAYLWGRVWPQTCFFDLWPVRASFATCFKRLPYFLIADQSGKIEGMMALNWIEEEQYFGHFPGETYHGQTWLEQNRIPARSPQVLNILLDSMPGPVQLRYLAGESVLMDGSPLAVDEIGYLFLPRNYNFSFQNYMQSFSGKSRKKLARESAGLQHFGVTWRYNHFPDVDQLFRMNMANFGEWSYFKDSRFLASFEKLVHWLSQNNMLRVTTLSLGGTVAAIDIGALWNRSYTVLAGATHPDFPGVAKMINFHHMEWGCRQGLEIVDFLCGDFGWKKRFHLTSRPLYKIDRQAEWNVFPEFTVPSLYANAQ
ncbi:MAG: GNAT family N-acetyltransferase [Desulfobulbaceae bacterium]|nr:GNAT family N-acetyltransferase [Desulfobulbaceae bacterium]